MDNLTNIPLDLEDDFQPVRMDPVWRLVWNSLFGGNMFLSIIGNLTILGMLLSDRTMWSIPNVFIMNMSFSDLMLTTLNCISNYIYMRDQNWYFSESACAWNNFFAILTISASVLNLTAMSMTRYYAIVFPLKPKLRRFQVFLIIAVAWIISIGLALPNFFYSEVISMQNVKICVMSWTAFHEEVFNIVLAVCTYILPVLLIFATTVHMSTVLWCHSPIGEINETLQSTIKKKKRIVKLLWLLLLVFGVCWFPYHLYFIVIIYYPHIKAWSHIQNVFMAFYLLAMSHAVVNPLVYFKMNKKLRHKLLSLVFPFLEISGTSDGVQVVYEVKNCKRSSDSSPKTQELPTFVVQSLPFSPKQNGKKIPSLGPSDHLYFNEGFDFEQDEIIQLEIEEEPRKIVVKPREKSFKRRLSRKRFSRKHKKVPQEEERRLLPRCTTV